MQKIKISKNSNYRKIRNFRNFDFFIENSNILMIFENSKMFQIFFRAAPKNDFRQDKLIFLIQIFFKSYPNAVSARPERFKPKR